MNKTLQTKFVTAAVAAAVTMSSFLFAETARAATPAENQRTYASQITDLYRLIVDARNAAGLPATGFVPTLSLQHVQPYTDMLAAGDLGLVQRDLSGLKQSHTLGVGEILYAHHERVMTPQFVMNVLMGSEGTRNSILRSAWENTGLGWSKGPGGKVYVSIVSWSGPMAPIIPQPVRREDVYASLTGGSTPTPTPTPTPTVVPSPSVTPSQTPTEEPSVEPSLTAEPTTDPSPPQGSSAPGPP